jgi:hypothetical protein
MCCTCSEQPGQLRASAKKGWRVEGRNANTVGDLGNVAADFQLKNGHAEVGTCETASIESQTYRNILAGNQFDCNIQLLATPPLVRSCEREFHGIGDLRSDTVAKLEEAY